MKFSFEIKDAGSSCEFEITDLLKEILRLDRYFIPVNKTFDNLDFLQHVLQSIHKKCPKYYSKKLLTMDKEFLARLVDTLKHLELIEKETGANMRVIIKRRE